MSEENQAGVGARLMALFTAVVCGALWFGVVLAFTFYLVAEVVFRTKAARLHFGGALTAISAVVWLGTMAWAIHKNLRPIDDHEGRQLNREQWRADTGEDRNSPAGCLLVLPLVAAGSLLTALGFSHRPDQG